ncbi:MAG: glutamate racemase [Chloroflexota bacterium]
MDNRPIGVFDSGLGGLTVVRQLMQALPTERIVYLGDTARVPYGSRSAEIVRKFARQDAYFLAGRNVKYIVIACNTVSAQAEADLVRRLAIPVLGVIQPGAAAAVEGSTGRIGVIGTLGTIASGAYQRAIATRRTEMEVVAWPCPLFVPLAEEGAQDTAAARLIAEDYLAPFRAAAVDSLILGCTHYPILEAVIAKTMGPAVRLVDPGVALAAVLVTELARLGLQSEGDQAPQHQYFVTDRSVHFQELAERFLGRPLCSTVEQVDLD